MRLEPMTTAGGLLIGSLVLFAVGGQPAESHTLEPLKCPKIKVQCPDTVIDPGETAEVKGYVDGARKSQYLAYEWSVHGANLLEGQGTLSIKVMPRAGESTTTTLRVLGLDSPCPEQVSCSFPVR